jgi:hypothetical protein
VPIICTERCPLFAQKGAHYLHRKVPIICTERCPLFAQKGAHYLHRKVSIICTERCPLFPVVSHSYFISYHRICTVTPITELPTSFVFRVSSVPHYSLHLHVLSGPSRFLSNSGYHVNLYKNNGLCVAPKRNNAPDCKVSPQKTTEGADWYSALRTGCLVAQNTTRACVLAAKNDVRPTESEGR